MSTDSEGTDWIVAERPRREAVDARTPRAWFVEKELSESGEVVDSLCILLTGKECPWRCLMCDLWKHTLTYPTPSGAIPQQIDFALAQEPRRPEQVKLYNSGSFFDVAAVPPGDYRAIAEKVSFAGRVVVESHPRLVGERTLLFRDMLSGALEVALGLETAQPDILRRLNKRIDLSDFERAATFLRKHSIALRTFILVQPPFTTPVEAVSSAVRSAAFAFQCGASVVSLIPTRPGNGALDRLMATGNFTPPTLATLEQALESALRLQTGRAFADTWDLEQFSACSSCFEARRERLALMNLHQKVPSPVVCPRCQGSGRQADSKF